MSVPINTELKKITTVGGSVGVILAPSQLLRLNWKKGDYVWAMYFGDRVELKKYDFKPVSNNGTEKKKGSKKDE